LVKISGLGRREAALGGVLGVVEGDREDLARLRDGRAEGGWIELALTFQLGALGPIAERLPAVVDSLY
jgi:hypothetical protein